MPRKINKKGPVAPEMNITPLIDVVFLLIIFFMIVSKIVSDERIPMIVPQLQDPQARELQTERTIIVNVAQQSANVDQRKDMMAGPDKYTHLAGPGEAAYIKVGAYKQFPVNEQGLNSLKQLLRNQNAQRKEVEVLLRADSALYYKAVAPVMNAITSLEIEKVNVVAYEKETPF